MHLVRDAPALLQIVRAPDGHVAAVERVGERRLVPELSGGLQGLEAEVERALVVRGPVVGIPPPPSRRLAL